MVVHLFLVAQAGKQVRKNGNGSCGIQPLMEGSCALHDRAAQVATEPGYLATDTSLKEATINRLSEEGRLSSETLCTTCIVEKVST